MQKRNILVILAIVTLFSISAHPSRFVEGFSGDLIEAYFSDTPITAGGFISGAEWVGHNATIFSSADGLGTNGLFIKYDANSSNLYISLYVWSDGTTHPLDSAFLYLDMGHDGGDSPNADDYIFLLSRTGMFFEDWGYNETAQEWDMNLNYTSEWTGYYVSIGNTWGVMWVIPVTAEDNPQLFSGSLGDNQRMGIAVRQLDYPAQLVSNYPSILNPLMPSMWAEVVFSKLDSSIIVSSALASITYGETTDLSSMINRTVSRGMVTLQYSKDGGVWTDITSGTPSDGQFSYTWAPAAGSYNLRAVWSGDIVYRASTSQPIPLTVEKAPSSTSTSLSLSTITYKENVTVTSGIIPTLSEGILAAEYSMDKVEWTQIGSSVPSEGSYSFVWTPPSAGTYYVRSSWSGTGNYLYSTSMDRMLTVNKAPTSLQVSASPETTQIDPISHGGATIQISGSITPSLAGIDVTITYTRPDGGTTTVTTTSSSTGEYTDTLSPNIAGAWKIEASWTGNNDYLGSTSSRITVNIGENWLPYIGVIAIIAIIIIAIIAVRMRKK